MSFLDELNPVQREAVESVNGPLLVLAGPGSGKTRVLTYRIAHLLSMGVPPWKILSLTFTNKAAGEMRERMIKLAGDGASQIWMGTFHSMFARIMRSQGEALGYGRNFTIYDSGDSQALVKSIQTRLGIPVQQFSTNGLRSRISSAKNQLVDAPAYEATARDPFAEKTALVFTEYQKQLKANNAMDFDDLLVQPIELFNRNPDILRKYQNRFHFVLVDEYQDTNRAQYVLLTQLVGERKNICVVGDDAQSIYSFRGANIRNILEFERDYPEAKVVRLEQNYRSTGTILSAADAVISKNLDRLAKNLWTKNSAGEPVTVVSSAGDREEASVILQAIGEEIRSNSLDFRDFAVMYRTNAQSRVIEDAFRRQTIPYRLIGGVEFYQRKEIKDILAYLRLVVNPSDNESFNRSVNVPVRGVGKSALGLLVAFARSAGVGLLAAAERAGEIKGLSKRAASGLMSFTKLISDHQKTMSVVSAGECTRTLVDRLGFLPALKEEGTPEAISRWENIQELLSAITEYADTREDPSLENFLQEVSLLSSVDRSDDGGNAVTLMTLHAAKGLEFPVVFITGLEEGILPLYNGGEPDRKDLEEERRLCYVGMTRAKERLYCSHAHVRLRFGEYLSQVPSRFLEEIPAELVRTLPYTTNVTAAPGRGRGVSPRRRDRKSPVGDDHWYHTDPEVDLSAYTSDVGELKKGAMVEHEQFGRGKVIDIEYAGESSRAVVDFGDFGSKHLILKYARLKII